MATKETQSLDTRLKRYTLVNTNTSEEITIDAHIREIESNRVYTFYNVERITIPKESLHEFSEDKKEMCSYNLYQWDIRKVEYLTEK